jgi:hypothetical protein
VIEGGGEGALTSKGHGEDRKRSWLTFPLNLIGRADEVSNNMGTS